MLRLLVPIDSSDNARRALGHAIELARKVGSAELVIVNAHEPPLVYGEVAVYLPEAKAREMQRQHSADILEPALATAKAAGVAATGEILTGNLAETIAKCAEDRACDGIVMGTRGMGAVANLVLGSVATKVVHLAKVPVTLVK